MALVNIKNVTNFVQKIKFASSIRTAVDLAYKIHGKSPSAGGNTVIVLHGLLGSKKNWESVSKKIAQEVNCSVIVADIRNHGESPHVDDHTYRELASDVSKLIEKLSVKQATVLGHSMGGRTAMVLALTEPNKVSKLIVVDISPVSAAGLQTSFFPDLLAAMETVDFSGSKNVREAKNKAREKLKTVIHEATINFIIMNVGEKNGSFGWLCNINALKNHFIDIAQFPPDMSGKQFNGPTLFIGGDQSDYLPLVQSTPSLTSSSSSLHGLLNGSRNRNAGSRVPSGRLSLPPSAIGICKAIPNEWPVMLRPSDLIGIKELFPSADLKYVNGVGHNVHAENPQAFIALVTDFLKK